MAEEKKYNTTLKGIIDAANKFVTGEWNEDQIAEYGETMVIRPYIPIMDKTIIIVRILAKHLLDAGTAEFTVADIYKDLFFYVLLQEYAMVDCSNEELITFENYDLLYPLYHPFITSYCGPDFELFKEMFKDSISISNIRELLNVLKDISEDTIKDAVAANANMLNTFNKNQDLIEKLNNINIMNDPTTMKVVEELKKMALEQAMNNETQEETK